jgi:hypothetical protein
VGVAGARILKVHGRKMREPRRIRVNQLLEAAFGGWWRRPTDHDLDQVPMARELLAKRAAWDRFSDALNALEERRAAFVSCPSDLTAEQVILAGMELEDAVAVAGEFQVFNLPWRLE